MKMSIATFIIYFPPRLAFSPHCHRCCCCCCFIFFNRSDIVCIYVRGKRFEVDTNIDYFAYTQVSNVPKINEQKKISFIINENNSTICACVSDNWLPNDVSSSVNNSSAIKMCLLRGKFRNICFVREVIKKKNCCVRNLQFYSAKYIYAPTCCLCVEGDRIINTVLTFLSFHIFHHTIKKNYFHTNW